jgi:hypothetical protein
MDTFLDICQAAGLALAVGIRPFLPALLIAVLAGFDAGIDFDGTSFAFLEQAPFMLVIIALLVMTVIAQRRLGPGGASEGRPAAIVLTVAVILGALEMSGALDAESETWWWGLPVGAALALFAYVAIDALLSGARRRLDAEAQMALPAYAEATGMVLVVLAVFVPPVSIVAAGLLAWLLAGARRRAGEKYAGLRILR